MKKKITVESLIKVDVEQAWKLWTEPKHIRNWNFASDDWQCPFAENDLKSGGKFKFTMSSKDGTMSFDFEGEYEEIDFHERIAYFLEDGREVIVVFDEQDGQCQITESFDPEDENPLEMQREGWQAVLNNFKKYAESL